MVYVWCIAHTHSYCAVAFSISTWPFAKYCTKIIKLTLVHLPFRPSSPNSASTQLAHKRVQCKGKNKMCFKQTTKPKASLPWLMNYASVPVFFTEKPLLKQVLKNSVKCGWISWIMVVCHLWCCDFGGLLEFGDNKLSLNAKAMDNKSEITRLSPTHKSHLQPLLSPTFPYSCLLSKAGISAQQLLYFDMHVWKPAVAKS